MSEKQKIVVLLDCFTKAEAEAALAAYSEAGENASLVSVAPVTELVAPQNTAEAIEAVVSGHWPGGTPRTGGRRGALISGADKRGAVLLVRCFKSVLPEGADPAFAMVTQTGRTWTVHQYLEHIRKEHEFMKTANPADDPDMKIID